MLIKTYNGSLVWLCITVTWTCQLLMHCSDYAQPYKPIRFKSPKQNLRRFTALFDPHLATPRNKCKILQSKKNGIDTSQNGKCAKSSMVKKNKIRHVRWLTNSFYSQPKISESGLAFSTDARCADLHGLSDLGFLCSLGGGLQKEKQV